MLKATILLIMTATFSPFFATNKASAQSLRTRCRRAIAIIHRYSENNVARAQNLSTLFKEYPTCYDVWDDMNREYQYRNDRHLENMRRQSEINIRNATDVMDMLN